jgi:hypothetical protein
VAKMLRQQKTVSFFSTRKRSPVLSHILEVHMQHTKSLQSRPEFDVCDSVCNLRILACIVLAVASIYKIL